MLDPLAKPLASLLAWIYGIVPNYAISILILTVIVMLVLAPLTIKGTRSMLAMQKLQPEIKRLQQEHKNDRQALNEAMMAFYKEHKINPLGGCLPLILQMPVFFVLYEVIRGLTRIQHGVLQPRYISHNSHLYHDLQHSGGKMVSFGMDLAKSAIGTHDSVAAAIPFWVLIALMMGTQYYQQRQLNVRNPQAAQNPQAQMMQKIFPIFFGFISLRIASGVVLYWVAMNMIRIGQQWAMYRFDPSLSGAVAAEVREVEARAAEVKRKERGAKPAKPDKPAKADNRSDNRQSAKNGGNGNGRATGARPTQSGRVTPPQRGKRARRGR
jgi:YidC/Oxa1 family membrane protein insertase